MLNVASNFYLRGFQYIRISALSEDGVQKLEEPSPDDTGFLGFFGNFEEFLKLLTVVMTETLIAVLFWIAIILLFRGLF